MPILLGLWVSKERFQEVTESWFGTPDAYETVNAEVLGEK
jgi:hypothetical protein